MTSLDSYKFHTPPQDPIDCRVSIDPRKTRKTSYSKFILCVSAFFWLPYLQILF